MKRRIRTAVANGASVTGSVAGVMAWFCLVLLALFPGHARAAGEEYTLQPGDVLHIQVLNPGFSDMAGDVLVQPDGRVKLPVKPPRTLSAAGLTANQFEAAAQRAFGGFIRNAAVVVTLKTAHVPTVFLLGAFTRNGPYPIQGQLRALEAVALAGGAPLGDLSQAVLTRGHTSRTLDLDEAQRSGTTKDNVSLEPEDVLFVPETRAHVTVQGQVMTPRNLEAKRGMSLEEAIAGAGGPTLVADLSHVMIARSDGQQLQVDLFKSITAGIKDSTVLRSGDIITVPQQLERVLVLGEVTHPQTIQYRPDLTLDDALVAAGGETSRADLRHVKLARVGTEGIQNLDMARERREGRPTAIGLKPGDVVTIPAMTEQVFVLGAVSRPGPVPYRAGMTVLEALSGPGDATNPLLQGAGGPTPRANLYQAVLTHVDGQHLEIDLDRLIRAGDSSQNVTLQAGDSLYVPESKREILVFGAVPRPAAYVLAENNRNRLLDALQLAGGPAPNANIKEAQLLRTVNGKVEATPVHLDRLLRSGELQYNIPMIPGDVLYIPERSQPGVLQSNAPTILFSILPYLLRIR